MKQFMDKDFLLSTETAKTLYHDYAAQMPILDYHCHINPQEIWAYLDPQDTQESIAPTRSTATRTRVIIFFIFLSFRVLKRFRFNTLV